MNDVGDMKIFTTKTSGADSNLERKDYAAVSDLLKDVKLLILYESC